MTAQLARSLEADDEEAARFHDRQVMQFVALGLADRERAPGPASLADASGARRAAGRGTIDATDRFGEF